ncbi:hypothetical protein LZ31DRAFT_559072 [Colletotrichum somersetense]|nr:hypothetical protein LZ31DRAFT_559072 [Colletotrichum somersetense]
MHHSRLLLSLLPIIVAAQHPVAVENCDASVVQGCPDKQCLKFSGASYCVLASCPAGSTCDSDCTAQNAGTGFCTNGILSCICSSLNPGFGA